MKRITKITISILIFISLALSITVLIFFTSDFFPEGKYIQSGNQIDNGYNNSYLSEGAVVEIDNKLYFNYDANDSIFRYGLYEISENSCKRIYWQGSDFEAGNSLYMLQKIDDNLLFSNYGGYGSYSASKNEVFPQFVGDIMNFNPETKGINELYSIDINGAPCVGNYYIIDNKFYIFTNEKIYVSDDGVNVEEIFDGLENVVRKTAYEKLCYISDSILIYVNDSNYLVKYDLLKKKQISAVSLSEISSDSDSYRGIFVCGEDTILTTKQDGCACVYSVDDKVDLIYKKEIAQDYYYINSCDDKIFISSRFTGLDMLDINTGNVDTLVEEDACDTYILDDKWVYFTDGECKLHRVTLDGKTFEKVFG